jgi:DNA recombination protein RmuC
MDTLSVTIVSVIVIAALLAAIVILLFSKLSKMQETVSSSLSNSITQIQNSVNSSVVQSVSGSIEKFVSSMGSIKEEYGQISNRLLTLNEIGNDTKTLKSILTNARTRGQWGERMVEDIINLVGLQENISYSKQETTEAGRPDFTFFLPNGKNINLDAKFSLDNYVKYIEAESDSDKERHKKSFIGDVKGTIRDVSRRNYINENTVDFAIVFIANEGTYSFLLAEEPGIIDEAIHNKIVLCSPITLYATLSVVRQASRYYALEKGSKEVLELMEKFKKEWGNFTKKFEDIDTAIEDVRSVFNAVSTTRKNKLDAIVNNIDSISNDFAPDLVSTTETENNKPAIPL